MAGNNDIIVDYLKQIVQQFNTLNGRISSIATDTVMTESANAQSQLNTEIIDISRGKYIRDNNRIIISAPEVIIGDLDKAGNLSVGREGSQVTIRSNNISIEGVSSGQDANSGIITSRAPRIHNIAVDPGITGKNNIVKNNSEIVSHAKSIDIISESSNDLFVKTATKNGLNIESTTSIGIKSGVQHKTLIQTLNNKKTIAEQEISNLNAKCTTSKTMLTDMIELVSDIVNDDAYAGKPYELGQTHQYLDYQNRRLESYVTAIYQQLDAYFKDMVNLIEQTRVKTVITDKIDALNNDTTYDTDTTGAKIAITSEIIDMMTKDGEGDYRNKNSAISMSSNMVNIFSPRDDAGKMDEASALSISTHKVDIDTSDSKIANEETTYTSNGSIAISTKDINIKSADYKEKDNNGTIETTTTAVNGTMSIAMSGVEVLGLDQDLKAAGKFTVNAKDIVLKGVDINKENGEDVGVNEASSLLIMPSKISIGSLDGSNEKMVAKSVEIFASEKVNATGTGDSAKITLTQKKKSITGEISADGVTLTGDVNIKTGDLTNENKLTTKELKATSKFSGNNCEFSGTVKGPANPQWK